MSSKFRSPGTSRDKLGRIERKKAELIMESIRKKAVPISIVKSFGEKFPKIP
jgi:hypothetical protein